MNKNSFSKRNTEYLERDGQVFRHYRVAALHKKLGSTKHEKAFSWESFHPATVCKNRYIYKCEWHQLDTQTVIYSGFFFPHSSGEKGAFNNIILYVDKSGLVGLYYYRRCCNWYNFTYTWF